LDNASLDLIDFYGMFNDTIGALPFVPEGKELPRWPWSWKERAPPVAGDGGGGAAAAAADEDLHFDAGLLATLQVEWSRFKAFTANSIISEPCTVMVEDKKLPARYWIRTRPFWPDLSELMLLWLKTPISTACVERLLVHDDHGQQDAASKTRRSTHFTALRLKLKEAGFHTDFMAHLHREWLESALRVAAK
jgi:hypothetical protein